MLIRGYSNTRTGKQEMVLIEGIGYSHHLSPEPSLQYFRATEKFHWGHGDNFGASSQLSFALILHFCGAYEAWNHYGDFNRDVVSKFYKLFFALESKDIKNYVRWRNSQSSALKKLFWIVAARWMFSDIFYECYFKKLLRTSHSLKSILFPILQSQSLQTA